MCPSERGPPAVTGLFASKATKRAAAQNYDNTKIAVAIQSEYRCLQAFLREIFPALRTRAGLSFRVIGACSPPVRRELEKHAGVEVTGTVRRIADAVDGVFCGVCPVRAGAGIQSKILNYLALGIPCVTSDVGLEGLKAVDGRDVLVYRKPENAVDLILKLHGDSSLKNTMAENGGWYVESAHDWKTIHASIREDVSELLAAK